MNKHQAKNYLNKPVHIWTATKGSYIGLLKEVKERKGKPWRGKVEVITITELPDRTRRKILPFSKGDIVEAGGINIISWNEEIPDYDSNFRKLLSLEREFLDSCKNDSPFFPSTMGWRNKDKANREDLFTE